MAEKPRATESLRHQIDSAFRRSGLGGAALFEGIEVSTGCQLCRQFFAFRSGALEPLLNKTGSPCFLCGDCAERLNRAREEVGLPAFPFRVAAYRGCSLPDEVRQLTQPDWAASTDGRELLRFAAARVPRRHLVLVVASVASSASRHFISFAPEDLSVSLGIAALNAWSHGETTDDELRTIQDAVLTSLRRTNARSNPAAFSAINATLSALDVAVAAEPSVDDPAKSSALSSAAVRIPRMPITDSAVKPIRRSTRSRSPAPA